MLSCTRELRMLIKVSSMSGAIGLAILVGSSSQLPEFGDHCTIVEIADYLIRHVLA